MKKFKVLHIDTDHGWRGGQQQAFYLHSKLMEKNYESRFICQPGSELEIKLKKENLNYTPIKMSGEIDIFAGKKIAEICKNEGFNILHLHDAHALAIGLYATLFCDGLKLIGVRRVDFNIKKNIFSRYKYNSKRMTRLVAISNEIKRVMLEDGIPENKIEVIKSGVDINKYTSIEKSDYIYKNYKIPENGFIVGTVAALAGHKDYPNFLRAAKIITEQNNDIYFIALGDGPDEKEIMELAKELKILNRFIFAGFQSDVGNHLKNFDVFVLSSHMEGLGTSVMDAMAAELPCVCCKSGGIPELIDHNENGILVEKKNPAELAKNILELYINRDLRSEISKKALLKSKIFSIDKTVEENIKLYEKLSN